MTEICYITTCMGRLNHLQKTLGTWVAQPNASCIVVDYSCPDRCGDWVEQNYPRVRVIRVTGQSRFHKTIALNVGARGVEAPWLFFIDADVALTQSFAESVLPRLRPGRFYRAVPWEKETSGTFLCPRADFTRVEGYDEVLKNYGGDDLDLYARLRWVGVVEDGFPAHLVQSLPHDDDLRVKFYDVKQKDVSDKINGEYTKAKYGLTKLLGRFPSLDVRRQLYGVIARGVENELANGVQRCGLKLDVHQRHVRGAVEHYLVCTLTLGELGEQKETSEIVLT